MGLEGIVSVVEYDVTSESVLSVLPKAGTVDIVTMSYSFSMIPDQRAAIANATKLLKQDGLIAIADFFLKGNYDDCLPPTSRRLRAAESLFHKTWFSLDHVFLLSDEQVDLSGQQLTTVWDKRFRGSVPFLPFLQPFHGVYILKKN
jgi:hypothetical protein